MDDSSVGPRRSASFCIAFVSASEAADGPEYVSLHLFVLNPVAMASQSKKQYNTISSVVRNFRESGCVTA